jgi:hypothetical protein
MFSCLFQDVFLKFSQTHMKKECSFKTSGIDVLATRCNNDLIVYTTETVTMSFCLRQSKPPYKPNILLQITEITYTSEVKFLGIYITENLSWLAHICSLCHSLSKTYYKIKSLKNTLSTCMLWNVYYAHFQS